ncbi:CYTH domain-containing protein [Cohnella nanjingensis]|uniref:CYTH domain-containing protein n=1 Tax=Cohnella nanjingensis TaxID=1387779 RepID=A0A7X0RR49_9BACL|nr:CYTH domain-containing protein [Cohnella nanjingensis]MBB6672138.1 CYTH domain-containing protein [Cohnella nanjingensis]
MSMEIERKFLLPALPEAIRERFVVRSEQRIEQTYLAIDDTQELRIRRITDLATGARTYTHTFKNGKGLAREEIEYAISESLYGQVAEAFGAVALTKIRTTAEWEGLVVEIDRYDQLDLTVLEVEFDSEDAAHAFVAPDWFGRDISAEKAYSNKTVWRSLQRK